MNTISLFSGAGGLDIGATMAGANVICCIDTDPDSLETIKLNQNGHLPTLINGDVSELTGKDIIKACGQKKSDIDFMIGGPPCQSFSKNNYWTKSGHESLRRKTRMKATAEEVGRSFIQHLDLPKPKNRVDVRDDHRTNLVMEFARLIEEISPKGFLFENVSSILHPANKAFLFEFIKHTEKIGYKTRLLQLSSENFGVAQMRKRVFVIGHKDKVPGEPEQTHSSDGSLFWKPVKGTKEAIAKFKGAKFFEEEEIIEGRWAEFFPDIPPGMNYKALTSWAGYSPLFSVFTAWDASLHFESGYSKNLQFKEELLEDCLVSGWAVGDPRRTDNGPEVRVAVHPVHLPRYLQAMAEADASHLQGEERQQFFISRRPLIAVEEEPKVGQPEIAPVGPRDRVISTRLRRSGTFGPSVLAEFGQTCAICRTQLRIVEGAHIIPIHDERCRDEVWNGVCLCRNHHRLFDLRIVRLNRDGVVVVETDDINYLRGLALLGGFENVIQPFIGQTIRLPNYFHRDARLRGLFQNAIAAMSAN